MKRLWVAAVLAGCMTGCMMLPTAETKPPAKASATVVVAKPAITVDEVNEANATEMSLALSAELDQAQSSVLIPPEKPPEKPKK
jgi:hypothetical protein